MGAFYIVCEPEPSARARLAAALERSIAAQGFGDGVRVEAGPVLAAFFGKQSGTTPQVHVGSAGQFVGLCGTAMLDAMVGVDVARAMVESRSRGASELHRLIGTYCAVIGDDAGVQLQLDPLAVFKVYRSHDLRLFSSSFIAVAQALGSVSPDPQGVYEYVFQGAVFGGATVAREICLVKPGECYLLGEKPRIVEQHSADTTACPGRKEHDFLEACLSRLREIYHQIAVCYGNSVDTALSGGYDSRLTLALLREQGVLPRIHVYGAPESPDVAVARAVTRGEGLELTHVDKRTLQEPDVSQYPDVVAQNFLVFDGWPSAGIFDSGADLSTRLARADGDSLMLNGGGGEIFRNFFYLPDRSYSPMEVVWSFFSRYSPNWCASQFDERGYLETLADKIRRCVGGSERLTRQQVELVYPLFRCGYWMGRNNSVNARLGWSMTPFVDPHLVAIAAGIPLPLKEHGCFEAALIRAVSPELARYPSDYGHGFDVDPPLRRIIKDHLTLVRPPRLRRYTYRVRYRQPAPRAKWLDDDWLSHVLDTRMPLLSEFFDIARVNDPGVYARIASLEYLFTVLRE